MPTSAPKSCDELLATPIGELVGCWLGVQCAPERCNRTSYIPLKLLAAKHRAQTRLGDVISRLRCQHCKVTPDTTWLVDYPVASNAHGGRAATWRVDLTPSSRAQR